ncbi:MAG: 3-oxoacyl-ACP reductase FabG [Myxococcales bacterium]|nr:3-oxoacyl-ACP reductase FabG [Myxococcales bacterium]
MSELMESLVVVTGASRGIGRAIALELGRGGARVIVGYRSAEQAAQEVVSQLPEGSVAVQADVSTPEGAEALLAAAEELGGMTALVNNAGISDDGLAMSMTDEQWSRVLDLNATGTFRMCRGALKQMFRERRGSIVNLVSVSGLRGNPGQANYAAAKAAVIGLTRTLAREMGRRSIRVNAVAPGPVETDMLGDLDERVLQGMKAAIPMRRLGTPEEIAPLVRFLVGPGSVYLTGQVIAVDGGMSC